MNISSMTTNRVRLSLSLEASLEISQPEAGLGLGEFYAPILGAEEIFDFSIPIDLNLRKMRHCRQYLTDTDLDHRAQVEKLSELILGRTELASDVGDKLVRLRRLCLGLFAEEELCVRRNSLQRNTSVRLTM